PSTTLFRSPCRSWRPHGDDQGRAPMKRVGWIVSLAAALSSGAAWSQESFAALLLKNSLSFTLPRDYSPVAVVANPEVLYQFAMKSRARPSFPSTGRQDGVRRRRGLHFDDSIGFPVWK